VDFGASDKLLIICSAFIRYLRKNGNNEAVLQLFIDLKKAYDSVRREILYNILIALGIPYETDKANKNVSETYSRVRICKHLSEMFPIRNGLKQADVLLPLLFSALEYTIRIA